MPHRARSSAAARQPAYGGDLRAPGSAVRPGLPHARLRLRDFAARYRVDRASAYRFLRTLEGFGLAHKDPATRAYTRGGKLVAWLAATGRELGLVDAVRPHLVALARETGESGHTAILNADQALLVDYVPAEQVVTVRNRVSVHEPPHCTAVGKAILAFLPEGTREPLLARLPLDRYTARTIDSLDALQRELARVRRAGVAVHHAE